MDFLIILAILSSFILLVMYLKKKYFNFSYEEETKNKVINKRPNSMYVHIPFCKHICSYCDFIKFNYNNAYVKKYIDVLINQIKDDKPYKCSTIYIGGGTPSALDIKSLDKLLGFLSKYLRKNGEFTIEVNPENINEKTVKLFKKHGINRVSIGVQTFDEELLKVLGRKHTLKDVKNCVNLLNKHEIENYSFDFIYGIHSQTLENINKDIDIALSLKPKHLSFYSLVIEEHTLLHVNKYPTLDDDKVREMYDFIYKKLKENKYFRYEVSNFSLKGYKSRHNLTYWNNKEYYGYGVGASSYVNRIRRKNSGDLNAYLNKDFKYKEDVIDDEVYEFEYIMLKLRLEKGINLKEYKEIFKVDFIEKYEKNIKILVEKKLLKVNSTNIKATYEGMMLLDYVIIELTRE